MTMLSNGTPRTSRVFFRINDLIEFEPATNTLLHCTTGVEFTLFIPASRCLLLLIENQKSIVSQQELMFVGWEKHGLKVSPNAFYQNIANIRRAFSELLPDSEIITTVKRVGLVISDEVRITTIAVNDETVDNQSEDVKTLIIKSEQKTTHCRGYSAQLNLFLLSFFSLLALAFNTLYYLYIVKQSSVLFQSDYFYYGKSISGCEIFLNKEGGHKLAPKDLEKINNQDCDNFKFAYATAWPEWSRKSILYCTTDNFGIAEQSCVNYFYGNKNQ